MDLNELRNEINQIDDQLLELFLRRMDIASQVADYKKAHDLPIYQPQREREIVNMRFGLEGIQERTQKEVAEYLGISQSYISRLEKRIMVRLRRDLAKQI